MNISGVLFGVMVLGVGVLIAGAGVSAVRTGRTISESEPVSVREAASASGTAAFTGTVQRIDDDHTFDAPFAGEEAVLATYKFERESDSDDSIWQTVSSGTIRRPFLVGDESGVVAVDPTDAEVLPANEGVETKEDMALSDEVRLRLSVLTDEYDLDSALPQADSDKRKFTEGTIGPGDTVHVYGTQVADPTPSEEGIDARLEASDTDSVYQITTKDKADVFQQKSSKGYGLIVTGLFFSLMGLLGVFTGL